MLKNINPEPLSNEPLPDESPIVTDIPTTTPPIIDEIATTTDETATTTEGVIEPTTNPKGEEVTESQPEAGPPSAETTTEDIPPVNPPESPEVIDVPNPEPVVVPETVL